MHTNCIEVPVALNVKHKQGHVRARDHEVSFCPQIEYLYEI